jgi:capsular exopolysaccharide synthesis family protein
VNTQKNIQKDLDFSIDIRKILQKLLLYKYVFICSFMIAAASAWYITAKTVPIYVVTASLLVKQQDNKNGGGSVGQLLYGSEMFGSGKKVANEIAQMQSSPFIQTIISRMNMKVLYEEQGDFYNKPIYSATPFDVHIIDSIKNYEYYSVEFINDLAFNLSKYHNWTNEISVSQHKLGDTITVGFNEFCIKPTQNFSATTKDKKYFFAIHTPQTLTNIYKGMLDIRQQSRDASIINLTISTQLPERDIVFLNKFMQEYVRYGLEDKTKEATKTIDFINKQLGFITDSLQRVESSLEAFKLRTKVTEAANPAASLYSMFISINEQKVNLVLADRYLAYLEDYIKRNDDIQKEKLVVPSVIGKDIGGGIESMIAKLVELQMEKNTYLRGGASKNPILKDINSQIDQLKSGLLESISNLRNSNSITIKDADSRLLEVEKKISTVPKSEREMVGIKRLFALNEDSYLLLLQKRLEADIARASATEDAKVIEPAATSGVPVAPKKRNNYVIAMILGLAIPLVLVIAKEYLKSVLRNQDDLERLSTIPLFGTIPHHTADKATPMTIVERPKSRISESFRSLRSNLAFFTDLKAQNNTFLFTSSISGEGKSFCSASFALVLASMGRKTLLIVTDLRKPKFYISDINVSDYPNGLSSYLIGETTIENIIQKSPVEHLDFIPPGALPPNPAELLTRQAFTDLLTDMKKKYDYIVIDTAPIGLVSDAITIMPYVDVTLYVVKQNYTPFAYISRLQEMYQEGKVKNIGFLLNDVKTFTESYGYGYGGYGYGGYGYGYGYYEEEKQSWWQKLNKRLWKTKK